MLIDRHFTLPLLLLDGGEGSGGAAGGESGSGSGGSGGSGSGAGGSGTGAGGESGGGSGSGGGTATGEGDWKPPTREEYDNLQRQAREAKTLREANEKAERERLAKAGEHEQVAKKEGERADTAEAKLRAMEARVALGEAKFAKPALAVKLLPNDVLGDEKKLADAIKQLAKDNPELLAKPATTRRQGNASGDDHGAGAASMNDMLRRAAGRT